MKKQSLVLSLFGILLFSLPAIAAAEDPYPKVICPADQTSRDPYWGSLYPCQAGGFSPEYAFSITTGQFRRRSFDTVIGKDSHGKLTAITTITSKSEKVCKGEESPRLYKKYMEDGKYSEAQIERVTIETLEAYCSKDLGGQVVREGGQIKFLDKEVSKEIRVRKGGADLLALVPVPRQCIQAKVTIQCDVSAGAERFLEIYREFKHAYPEHPAAAIPELNSLLSGQ